MRTIALAAGVVLWTIHAASPATAQGSYIDPREEEIGPNSAYQPPDYVPPRQHAPSPSEDHRWIELRERMFELRSACEEDDRRACVRLGIIIGENRARRAAWRRESPDLFWWER
jgi:hypothetical protein